ncbi:MAG: hypothetical protein JWN70_3083 [Planctomycetaceae bacterium]|nr:hypothetical protein [Planctomycetaceae bacterium]
MNIWGKVLAFLIILLGGGAFVLTTQLLDYRQSWMKQVEANRKALTDAKKATIEKSQELKRLQADYDRLMLGWDTYINNATASGDPAQGTLNLTVGPPLLNEGKDKDGKPVQPVIYAFQPGANGKYEYVGEFRAERIAAGNSSFKANWRMRPSDGAMWKVGPNWRVRTRIPISDKLKFDQMSLAFADADERFTNSTNELARSRDEFAKKIKLALANRENELQGFEAYEGDRGKLEDELIDGVLATLVREEEARNTALAQADALRHELDSTVKKFEKLKSINAKAANELRGNAAPTTAKVSPK